MEEGEASSMARRTVTDLLGVVVWMMCATGATAKRRKSKRRQLDSDLDPRAMTYHQRGALAHARGDLQTAHHEFWQAITVAPTFAYAYFRLGFVMQERRRNKRESAVSPTWSLGLPKEGNAPEQKAECDAATTQTNHNRGQEDALQGHVEQPENIEAGRMSAVEVRNLVH